MNASRTRRSAALQALGVSTLILVAGLIDLPAGKARGLLQSLRSAEANRADREENAAGYYEGLINRGGVDQRAEDDVALRLLGKPRRWINFHDLDATHYMPDQFLQFELIPNLERPVFDHVFTTNSLGLRDHEGYTVAKPAGTFRIVLLGSSIDMGWGVDVHETYENQFERWLNERADRIGLDRRFEVLNFAMAAYGPSQRMEAYMRKARRFEPDLVIFSATMLDPRLSQIHLCDVLGYRADPTYDFVHRTLALAGLTEADIALAAPGLLKHKSRLKRKLRPHLWTLSDGALETLATACRSEGVPLCCLIVPRAGLSDRPSERRAAVARYEAIADRHALETLDLSDAFDTEDPTAFALAPWDDHPNAEGHRSIFLELAQEIVAHDALSRLLFGAPGGGHVVSEAGALPKTSPESPSTD